MRVRSSFLDGDVAGIEDNAVIEGDEDALAVIFIIVAVVGVSSSSIGGGGGGVEDAESINGDDVSE